MGASKAIVVGGYVNALGVVRSLAARGVESAVVTTQPFDIAHRSRWACAHDHIGDLDERPDSLLEALERRVREWAGAVVIPTNDGALAALAAHHERLSASYRLAAPTSDVAQYFLDKKKMLAVASDVGIDTPRCYGPATAATAALTDIAFPVLVKPDAGHRFFARIECKVFSARDRAELTRAITLMREAGLDGQVFDLVPGADDRIVAYCTYVDARSEPRGGVTVRKLRQSPPFFGVARVAEIAPHDAELRDATLAIVRRTGFRGIATAEFKRDARDGRYRFIEINARAVVYNSLLRKAGLDTAGLVWSEHAHGRAEPSVASDWRGVWIHLHADLLYSLLYRRHDPISLGDFLAPYRRKKVYAVWSVADPNPFATQWSRTASTAVRSLGRARRADLLKERSRPGG